MPTDPRPEHLDEARALLVDFFCDLDVSRHVETVARALAQREADALERAAKVCDDLRAEQSARYDRRITRSPRDHASLALYDAQANAAGHLASRIRSLTPNLPARSGGMEKPE